MFVNVQFYSKGAYSDPKYTYECALEVKVGDLVVVPINGYKVVRVCEILEASPVEKPDKIVGRVQLFKNVS